MLIAGGGIAGLTTALALARRGIAAQVFETRTGPISEGAGIQLGPNATRILIDLGLQERLAPHVVVPAGIVVHDGVSGRELTRFPLGTTIRRCHGAPYWVVHRADLYKALLEAAEADPLITIAPGQTVKAVEAIGSTGIRVRMAEGGSMDGNFLVAADGLWSRLRALVAPSAGLEKTDVTAARTVLPMNTVPEHFRAPVTGIWLAPDSHVVHYPVHGGKSLAIVAIAPGGEAGSDWNTSVDADLVTARFARLPKALAQMFATAQSWRQWALMRGGITFRPESGGAGSNADLPMIFLGDASHPIQPFLAQGGAMAIEDAAVFADVFAAAATDTSNVMFGFEARRRRRIERVRAASIENGRIYHLSGVARTMRNALLSLTPGAATIRRYDWLYGWRRDT